MNNQPPEIVLQQLLQLDYNTINNLCSSNKKFKKICDENEKYIYDILIKRDFGLKVDSKLLYILFNTLKNDVNFFDKTKHYNVLVEQIKKNKINKFKLLLNYIDINVKNKNNKTVLMYALENSTPEIVNIILDLKPEINVKDKTNNWTALMFALQMSTPEIINRILDMNPDVNVKDKDNWTALFYAIDYSTPEIVNRILDLNPDINVKTNKNWTALIFALDNSTPEIINRILDMNPEGSLNIKTDENWTPITFALQYSTPEIINKILDMNPNITVSQFNKVKKNLNPMITKRITDILKPDSV
jgi:ankyrin repeat protein